LNLPLGGKPDDQREARCQTRTASASMAAVTFSMMTF
jgi:hypothetical protein